MSNKTTLARIRELQKQYGVAELQMLINSGLIWCADKSTVKAVRDSLEYGMCMLPKESYPDENNVLLPSRDKINGTQGSLERSEIFWQHVEDGIIKLERPL